MEALLISGVAFFHMFLAALSIEPSTIKYNSTNSQNTTNISSIEEVSVERDIEWFRSEPKEVVYVISGNRNFGGHGKQLFRAPILDIVLFTGEQFNETATRFGVVWANAYITMNIVAPLLAKASEAEHMLENFLHEVPEPFPTALSGLEGSIEYAMDNIFSPDRDIIKVMVLLTHWNMLHADVNEFLKQKCYRVVLFVLVFPWPYQSCETPKVQRMVMHMNKRLNMSGLHKNQMAYCGRRIDILEKFQPYIFDGYESFRTQVSWCDIHYPITTTTGPPPPCQWSYTDFQSMAICHGNVMYGALCLVLFFSVTFTCGMAWIFLSFISFIKDYRNEVKAKNKQDREKIEEICEEKPFVDDREPKPKLLNQFTSAIRAQSIMTSSVWGIYKKKKPKKKHKQFSKEVDIEKGEDLETTAVIHENVQATASENVEEISAATEETAFLNKALQSQTQTTTAIWRLFKKKKKKHKNSTGSHARTELKTGITEEECAKVTEKEEPKIKSENLFLRSILRSSTQTTTSFLRLFKKKQNRKPKTSKGQGLLASLRKKKHRKAASRDLKTSVVAEEILEIQTSPAPRKTAVVTGIKRQSSGENSALLEVQVHSRRQSNPEFQESVPDQPPQLLGLVPAGDANLRRKSISDFASSLKAL